MLRLDDDLLARLDARAAAIGKSRAYAAKLAVIAYLGDVPRGTQRVERNSEGLPVTFSQRAETTERIREHLEEREGPIVKASESEHFLAAKAAVSAVKPRLRNHALNCGCFVCQPPKEKNGQK